MFWWPEVSRDLWWFCRLLRTSTVFSGQMQAATDTDKCAAASQNNTDQFRTGHVVTLLSCFSQDGPHRLNCCSGWPVRRLFVKGRGFTLFLCVLCLCDERSHSLRCLENEVIADRGGGGCCRMGRPAEDPQSLLHRSSLLLNSLLWLLFFLIHFYFFDLGVLDVLALPWAKEVAFFFRL